MLYHKKLLPLPKNPPKCRILNCKQVALYSKGYCEQHYSKLLDNRQPINIEEHPVWQQKDIIWFAGLFDAEGTIGPAHKYFCLRICSTDKDIIENILSKLKVGKIYGPHNRGKYKPIYHWACSGKREVVPLLIKVLPFLCKRRKGRFLEALKSLGYENILTDYSQYSSEESINWMAGYYDGEGHLTKNLTISVKSTDLDMLEKCVNLFSSGKIYGPRQEKDGNKPVYQLYFWPVKTAEILSKIYPLLCKRRKLQIRTVINNLPKGKKKNCIRIWPESSKFCVNIECPQA